MKKQKIFADRMNKCQEILTPEQVVKLLVWIDENDSVLESACPGWGSERIRDQKPVKSNLVKTKSEPKGESD